MTSIFPIKSWAPELNFKSAPKDQVIRNRHVQVVEGGNGFVLAEAVVALAVAAIAVGGALVVFRQGQILQKETVNRTQALVICELELRRAQLERLQPSRASGTSSDNKFKWVTKISPAEASIKIDNRAVALQSVGNNATRLPNLVKIETEVKWMDRERERSLKLEKLTRLQQQ